MDKLLQTLLDYISTRLGWMYLLTVLGFVVFCLVLAFSRYGKIKLGKPDDEPEYSNVSWFAMLFSAGMGIGLVFWSVAEPLSHFANPPFGTPYSDESVLVAMRYTFFHWGIHPWAIYSVVGLALAYFTFRKDKPMLISSVFEPLVKKGSNGQALKVLDWLAVFATICGVATSLGLGTMQINSGLKQVFGIPNNVTINVLIIAVITFLFTLSALSGIGRGIKILSNTNIVLATLLLILMLIVGPTRYVINLITATLGSYIQNFFNMSLATDPVRQTGWVNSWTIFYWAWWIAWAPFVGMFIARISKGRTIKQFTLGVMALPVAFSFLWMGTFGGTALKFAGGRGKDAVPEMLSDIGSGLFILFQHYPLGSLLSGIALLLITTFFITSADSATFVVGMLLSRGSLEPAAATKVFWGVVQGGISILLLVSGGLVALQTASIIAALPFMFVMIMMGFSLVKELSKEVSSGGVN